MYGTCALWDGKLRLRYATTAGSSRNGAKRTAESSSIDGAGDLVYGEELRLFSRSNALSCVFLNDVNPICPCRAFRVPSP